MTENDLTILKSGDARLIIVYKPESVMKDNGDPYTRVTVGVGIKSIDFDNQVIVAEDRQIYNFNEVIGVR